MEIGRKEGLQEGEKQERYIIVKRLIEIGMPDGHIAAVSQLDISEIEKIKKEMNCEPIGHSM